MGADQRHGAAATWWKSGDVIAQREGEVLTPVDEPVEAEDPGVRRVPVGEPQGQRDLRADRRGGRSQRHPLPRSAVLEPRREGVPQEHHVADLANVDERRPTA